MGQTVRGTDADPRQNVTDQHTGSESVMTVLIFESASPKKGSRSVPEITATRVVMKDCSF
jgi:hypothetical protein